MGELQRSQAAFWCKQALPRIFAWFRTHFSARFERETRDMKQLDDEIRA
jgi:hypothetical protein